MLAEDHGDCAPGGGARASRQRGQSLLLAFGPVVQPFCGWHAQGLELPVRLVAQGQGERPGQLSVARVCGKRGQ
jgi:hypothetical protein